RNPEGGGASEKLKDEPQSEDDDGGNLAHGDEEKDRDQRGYARAGKHHDISAQHAGDRAGRSDGGHARVRIHDGVRQRGQDSADQIEKEVLRVAEAVLDIVAKDPEIEHVSAEVDPAAVEKHGDEDGDDIRQIGRVPEASRNERHGEQGALDLRTERQLPEEDEDVRGEEI